MAMMTMAITYEVFHPVPGTVVASLYSQQFYKIRAVATIIRIL
jgi:hypothetical protein